jgi:hypothetical protein
MVPKIIIEIVLADSFVVINSPVRPAIVLQGDTET